MLLKCEGLTKKFGNKTALDELNFEIPLGRIVGLLGPNGSGKTTLIKMIAGLLTPTTGSCRVQDNLPDIYTRSVISYLPDRSTLPEWMNSEQIITFYDDFYADFEPDRARTMMDQLGVDRTQRYKALSKGTQDKVQLILAMSRKADLYLLDEPIGGVDPAARDYILKTIINNYEPTSSVLISTHLISDVEPVLDEVLFLNNGRLVLQAEVDTLREETGKSVNELFREEFTCLAN